MSKTCWDTVWELISDIGCTHHCVVVHQYEVIVRCHRDVCLPHISTNLVRLARRRKGVLPEPDFKPPMRNDTDLTPVLWKRTRLCDRNFVGQDELLSG